MEKDNITQQELIRLANTSGVQNVHQAFQKEDSSKNDIEFVKLKIAFFFFFLTMLHFFVLFLALSFLIIGIPFLIFTIKFYLDVRSRYKRAIRSL